MKIIINLIPTNLVTNSLISLFCSFLETKNKNLNFQQVGDLVTRNISVFRLWRVALCFKGMLNSMDFYKRIFLHDIPSRVIVPCLK